MASTTIYCTAAEIRAAMNATGTDEDAKLTLIATAVSRMIDGFCGRSEDGFLALSTATAREYAGEGNRYLWIDECISISEVAIKNAVTETDYTALDANEWRGFRGDPKTPGALNFNRTPYHGVMLTASARQYFFLNGSFVRRPGFQPHQDEPANVVYEPTVRITAKWGFALTVPEIVRQAAIMQSERIYKRQQGAMADALGTGEFGEMRFVSKLDKDVESLLKYSKLVRPTFAGR